MIMSGKYYPNNWEAIKDAPDEFFEPCDVDDFFLWKLNGWEIPSSVLCVLRAEHIDTGQIKEHVYKSPKSAVNRLTKYMESGDYDVTVCNHDSITILTNNPERYDSDND